MSGKTCSGGPPRLVRSCRRRSGLDKVRDELPHVYIGHEVAAGEREVGDGAAGSPAAAADPLLNRLSLVGVAVRGHHRIAEDLTGDGADELERRLQGLPGLCALGLGRHP